MDLKFSDFKLNYITLLNEIIIENFQEFELNKQQNRLIELKTHLNDIIEWKKQVTHMYIDSSDEFINKSKEENWYISIENQLFIDNYKKSKDLFNEFIDKCIESIVKYTNKIKKSLFYLPMIGYILND